MQTEGNFSWKSGYVYVTVVTNFSQTWALYALVKFYRAAAPELAPWRPGICLHTYMYTPMMLYSTSSMSYLEVLCRIPNAMLHLVCMQCVCICVELACWAYQRGNC
jgi:Organic solute transporter Ostalpha